jgi:aminomethyltransferase
LYGHELSSSITPLQAGLNWAINWEKKDFLGRQKLLSELECGSSGRVKFYEVEDRRIPRDGSKILLDGKEYGVVLSGGYSPSIKKPIGSAWISSKGLEHINKSGWQAEVRSSCVDLFFAPPVLRRK